MGGRTSVSAEHLLLDLHASGRLGSVLLAGASIRASMGWTLLDMFGCNRDPVARRVDRNGVAVTIGRMLSPISACAVDADHWHLADQRGSILRFPRMDRGRQVLLWQAYAPRSGP